MINYKGYKPEELGITDEVVTKHEKLRFYNIKDVPEFRVYGLYDYKNGEKFKRMPEAAAEKVSEGVRQLNYCTAGGRVRFTTTSGVIAVRATTPNSTQLSFGNPIGMAGFDIYISNGLRDIYLASFTPNNGMFSETGMCDLKGLPGGKKEITLNLPLHQSINELYIGLIEDSDLETRPDYRFEKPVLYYGSSITQGLCASRPGMAYEAIISRKLDCNFINLGFSGKCYAELPMCEYLQTVDCSAFVYDYDHNSGVEMLRDTHERLYRMFRDTHPETPVIIVGRPDFFTCDCNFETDMQRREIVMNTFRTAKDNGENVIYVDGYSLFGGEDREDCTVDLVHPNDLGMTRMADVIGKAVEYAIAPYKVG